MTILDLAEFARLQLRAAKGRPRLVTAATVERVGLPPEALVSGGNRAFLAELRILPDEDIAVVVTANSGGPGATRAMRHVHAALRERCAKRAPDVAALDRTVVVLAPELLSALRAGTLRRLKPSSGRAWTRGRPESVVFSRWWSTLRDCRVPIAAGRSRRSRAARCQQGRARTRSCGCGIGSPVWRRASYCALTVAAVQDPGPRIGRELVV